MQKMQTVYKPCTNCLLQITLYCYHLFYKIYVFIGKRRTFICTFLLLFASAPLGLDSPVLITSSFMVTMEREPFFHQKRSREVGWVWHGLHNLQALLLLPGITIWWVSCSDCLSTFPQQPFHRTGQHNSEPFYCPKCVGVGIRVGIVWVGWFRMGWDKEVRPASFLKTII